MAFTLQPATKDAFINREKILDEMFFALTDERTRMGVALVGPRRVGKTSILKEVARRLDKKAKIVPVYFSLWDLTENTILEFCSRLTLSVIDGFKPYLSLKFKIKEILKVPAYKIFEVLRSLDIKIGVFEEMEISLRMGKSGEIGPNELIEKAFQFGARAATQNTPPVAT